MAQPTQRNFEEEFKQKLFDKYAECQEYLILRKSTTGP